MELMESLYETNEFFVEYQDGADVDYNKSYWGNIVDPDGVHRNLLEEIDQQKERVRYVWEFVNSLRPGNILDVGCGLGSFLSAVSNEWQKYGIEVSRDAGKYAEKECNLHLGTLDDSPYEKNFFDCIVMYHVIEHVEDPIKTIKKINTLLAEDGILIIGTPDFDSGCARRFNDKYRLLGPEHIRLFSNDSMHRFLRSYGFKINRVTYPFFESDLFTEENLKRLFDTSKVSPPFYGNYMTFFCTKIAGA